MKYAICIEETGTVGETESMYDAAKAIRGVDGGYVVRFERLSRPVTVAFWNGSDVTKTVGTRSDEIEAIAAIPWG